MREAGVKPEDIDIVLCTHLHVDHVGWNTRLENGRWVPTFPNARYLIGRRELDYWKAAWLRQSLERTGDYITDSVLPVIDAGQADLIGDEHAIAGDISVEPALGHTPGQLMVRLGSGREQGDPQRRPDAPSVAGSLSGMEHAVLTPIKTRRARPASSSSTTTPTAAGWCFPAHFPTPTGGVIERDGKDFRFTFSGETAPCCPAGGSL